MTDFQDEYDLPWKDIVEAYFRDFMSFFFPEIHAEIDWSRGYTFLDQELSQVVRDADVGKRIVDKLVKVWSLSGDETWVLINIEIQSQEESNFSARMFTHYYRLRDGYNLPIVNLAILGDERSTWRPGAYEASKWGCEVEFRFPIVKLLDYQPRWSELEEMRNPFAIVVMAHLKTKETKQDFPARREWKFRLTRMLYERDYSRQDIMTLYRFLDWILELPEGLKQGFRDDLKRYEEEKQMPYMTSIERMGIEEGRRSVLLRLLNRKLGALSEQIGSRISGLSASQLDELTEALLDFEEVEDLERWLAIER